MIIHTIEIHVQIVQWILQENGYLSGSGGTYEQVVNALDKQGFDGEMYNSIPEIKKLVDKYNKSNGFDPIN